MTLSFASLQDTVSFWYASFDPITLTAFDAENNSIGSIVGAANTDGTTGVSDPLSISVTGIASVEISSSAGQYVLDDLQFTGPAASVPEPSSGLLLLTMGAILFAVARGRAAADGDVHARGR